MERLRIVKKKDFFKSFDYFAILCHKALHFDLLSNKVVPTVPNIIPSKNVFFILSSAFSIAKD